VAFRSCSDPPPAFYPRRRGMGSRPDDRRAIGVGPVSGATTACFAQCAASRTRKRFRDGNFLEEAALIPETRTSSTENGCW